MHYVLAPAGAAVLAAEDGLDVKEFGYRHNRVFGIAHSLRLAHTSGSTSGSPPSSTVPATTSTPRCGRGGRKPAAPATSAT
jgi:hypothetical protein